jgi:hypothetical protein
MWVRLPPGVPIYISVVLTAARQSPKLLVGVQIPPGMPILGCVQQIKTFFGIKRKKHPVIHACVV